MIVELYGLTGSGKTYLSNKLKERGFSLSKFDSKFSKYLNSVFFIFLHPVLSFSLWHNLSRFPNNSTNLLPLRKRLKLNLTRNILLLATMAQYMESRSHRDAVVLDEGFFQIIHTVFERKVKDYKLKRLMELIPKPEILILVNSTKESRERRFAQGGYPRKDEFGSKYFDEWYEVMKLNDLKIRKVLKDEDYNFLIREFDIPKNYSQALDGLIKEINERRGKN